MDYLSSLAVLAQTNSFFSVMIALLLGVSLFAYHDYRSYVALGPHGLPDTVWGWYRQLQMTRKARKDTTVPAPYDFDSVAGAHDETTFLSQTQSDALSWRPGSKAPQVPGFVAPQRQVTDQATAVTKQSMYDFLDALADANPGVLQIRTSVLEGPVPAMGIKNFADMADSAKPGVLRATQGEMCHIHPPDGSTHLFLSLTDQKRLIELGWGRRHRLSGGGMLPWNYTFVYAPRDEDEVKTWKSIVIAAAKYCAADLGQIKTPRAYGGGSSK